MRIEGPVSRRDFLRTGACAAAGLLLPAALRAEASGTATATRVIPSSGKRISAIGMGTYITFNVGPSERLRRERLQVLQAFLDHGGGMIDSSPMYGSSEEVIGYCLKRAEHPERAFTATKVWTPSDDAGMEQVRTSERLWGLDRFDLQQVHNLVNRRHHLDTLRGLKESGRIRYLGVSTSHGRRHGELEALMRNEALDFVQLTYNIVDRETEDRLIPLARERGIAVIANRPYAGGSLMDRYKDRPLPDWAADEGIGSWADLFLKFIISHPGVTCAIPATSRVEHMHENMGALSGPMPDEALRTRLANYVAGL